MAPSVQVQGRISAESVSVQAAWGYERRGMIARQRPDSNHRVASELGGTVSALALRCLLSSLLLAPGASPLAAARAAQAPRLDRL